MVLRKVTLAVITSLICNLLLIAIVNVNIRRNDNLLDQIIGCKGYINFHKYVKYDCPVLLQTCGHYLGHNDQILLSNSKLGIITALMSCSSIYLSPFVMGMGLHIHRDHYLSLTDVDNATVFTIKGSLGEIRYGDKISIQHKDNFIYNDNTNPMYNSIASLCKKQTTFIIEPPHKQLNGHIIQYGYPFYLDMLGYKRVNNYDLNRNYYIGDSSHRTLFYLQPAYAPIMKRYMPVPQTLYNYGSYKTTKNRLRLLTYNIWMLPNFLTKVTNVSHSKQDRSIRIIYELLKHDPDVIVFTEAFDNSTREFIVRTLREHGFYYETPCLGMIDPKAALNGGIIIVSRYQIINTEQQVFKSACDDDSLANKGILYVEIAYNKARIHIFGAHMQAWNTYNCMKVREQQLAQLKEMSDKLSQNSNMNDIILYIGDFNINRYDNLSTAEYDKMLTLLDADDLLHSNIHPTIDPTTNKLAQGGTISNDGQTSHYIFLLYNYSGH
jgi:hypothetical protein